MWEHWLSCFSSNRMQAELLTYFFFLAPAATVSMQMTPWYLSKYIGNQDIICEHHVYLSEVGSKAKKVRIELCVGPVLMFKVGIYSSFSLELCCKSRTNGWNVLRNIVLFSWRNGKAKKNSNIFYFFRFIWDMFRQDKKRYFPKTMFCENDIAVKSYYYCEEKQCARTSL